VSKRAKKWKSFLFNLMFQLRSKCFNFTSNMLLSTHLRFICKPNFKSEFYYIFYKFNEVVIFPLMTNLRHFKYSNILFINLNLSFKKIKLSLFTNTVSSSHKLPILQIVNNNTSSSLFSYYRIILIKGKVQRTK
jgi:hypothetical protein